MLKRYITILVISILVVIFAIQNVEPVAINLWVVDVNASLSLIIIISLTVGALLTLLFAYQELSRRRKRIVELEKKLGAKKKEGTSVNTYLNDPEFETDSGDDDDN